MKTSAPLSVLAIDIDSSKDTSTITGNGYCGYTICFANWKYISSKSRKPKNSFIQDIDKRLHSSTADHDLDLKKDFKEFIQNYFRDRNLELAAADADVLSHSQLFSQEDKRLPYNDIANKVGKEPSLDEWNYAIIGDCTLFGKDGTMSLILVNQARKTKEGVVRGNIYFTFCQDIEDKFVGYKYV